MKLSDVIGEAKISSYHARTFITAWFDPDDKISIVGRKSEKVGKLNTVSQSMLASEFAGYTDEDLETLIYGADGTQWNLYFGVYPIKEDASIFSRGKEENTAKITGLYADLDVKSGGFSSQQEAIEFLFSLGHHPTIVVGSGSGGVHAYWKLTDPENATKDIVEWWWSFLDESAGDRSIDKLSDLTRIMRVPGTVYFPKPSSGGKIGSVEILYLLPEATYSTEQIRQISAEAFKAKHERRKALIDRDANRRMDMDSFARDLMAGSGGNRWRMWKAISELEDFVNERMTWHEILPSGWTFLRTLSDGSNEWARPGRAERSAVTDYEGSPVMSLLSMSEETGLADLKDAHIPLTKYRVFLRLQFEDNEAEMIKYLVGRLEDEGII